MSRKAAPKSQAAFPYLLAGGTTLAVAGFLLEPTQLFKVTPWEATCETMVQAQASLSRQKLSQLLTIPERAPRQQVRQVVKEPYCRLSTVEIRPGAMAEREAYPLEFDRQTWFVILYEGDEYVGYTFSFQQSR